nr:MAG TPA: Thioredoxin [Caudoviricetes sp.]
MLRSFPFALLIHFTYRWCPFVFLRVTSTARVRPFRIFSLISSFSTYRVRL